MRLACICDDGEVTDIASAIKQHPYRIRSLLLDSFFACFPSLPDSPDFFQAEHSIREALIKFQGDKERYVKSYTLTRSLDPRIEETPRAGLIHSSFKYGGPIALIGIFYATIDAHRNIRRRETLDYLLHKASEESKLALIHRTNTFPCDPSLTGWLGRILDRIDPDAQSLACILQWLGTPVPIDLFHRARLPSLSWNADGEVVEIPARLVSIIQTEEKLDKAIRNLEHFGFVTSTPTAIELNPRIAELLQNRLQSKMWLPKAARIIFHVLPKYASIKPESYPQQCRDLLPHVTRILGHLDGKYMLLAQVDLVEMAEACLSVSYFGDRSWKMQALAIASQAVSICKDAVEKQLLAARIDARRSYLSVLYLEDGKQDQLTLPIVDRRSNAFAAFLATTRAQRCIQLNQLTSALEYLECFNALHSEPPSTLEEIRGHQLALVLAKVLHFRGQFQQSYEILLTLPQQNKVLTLLGAVLCELGKCDEAIELLQTRVANTTRGKLILAHAHLLKCMHMLVRGQDADQISLKKSNDIYDEISRHFHPSNYYENMDHLSILMGRAIIQHISGQIKAALQEWKRALATSITWLPTGYTDMIIYYSISELEARRGDQVMSDVSVNVTKALLPQTGRQHYFLGLGSLWPDIVGRWRLDRGQDPIIPLQS
ncbi:hypothetical protein F4805DRAFT_409548 [Annulohypoxylon moriforme]|nr:hypothetical protein F4805DRAFT_409548 [Annulohypoxylon moriforme]